MTLGELQYLVTVNDKTDDGIRKSEGKIKKAEKQLTAYGIARAQMVMDFAKKAATSAVNAFKNTVKSAVSAYADYEQLVGGVETLFKGSAKKVQDYAAQAYKTVGISANEYMENVTSFSASLLQSLEGDTDKAADIADMAMQDMADNANKMGSSMESIQNAYQGFAKQNYTMLDNLKLGYGGTKTEMQRLLADAEKITKKKYDISNLSDVYEAIHAIQEEMGVTGTTALEAEKTISGSINMTKAAWKNLLIAIGSGRDVKKATKEFTKSFRQTITNIIPVAKQSIKGIFTAIKEALPDIKEAISDIWEEIKSLFSNSPIFGAITKRIEGLMGLFELFSDLITDFEGTMSILEGSDNPWLKGFGKIVRLGNTLINDINNGIDESGSLLFGTLSGATKFITDALLQAADWLGNSENVNKIVDILKNVLTSLATALTQILPELIPALTELVGKLAPALIDVVVSILGNQDVWASLGYMLDSVLRSILGDSIVGNFLGGKKKLVHTTGDDGKDHVQLVDDTEYTPSNENVISKVINSLAGFDEGSTEKKVVDFVTNDLLGTITSTMFKAELPTDKAFRIFGTVAKGIDAVLGTELEDGLNDTADNVKDKFIEGAVDTSIWLVNAGETFNRLVTGAGAAIYAILSGGGGNRGAEGNGGDFAAARSGGGGTEFSAGKFKIYQRQAKGNWYVPYDNYPSLLHRGEMVLTKSQARQFRDGGTGNGMDGSMVAAAVEAAMSRVYVMMSGEKVGDLTTKRIKKNLNASNYARMRALGG